MKTPKTKFDYSQKFTSGQNKKLKNKYFQHRKRLEKHIEQKIDKNKIIQRKRKRLKKEEKKLNRLEKKNKLLVKPENFLIKSAFFTQNVIDKIDEQKEEDKSVGFRAVSLNASAARTSLLNKQKLRKARIDLKKKELLKDKIKVNKINKKIQNKVINKAYKKDLQYRYKQLHKDVNFSQSSKTKQFFKKQLKKHRLKQEYGLSRSTKLKENVKNALKKAKNYSEKLVKVLIKNLILWIFTFLIVIILLQSMVNTISNIFTGTVHQTMSSSYLASEEMLQEIDNEYSSYEKELSDELSSVKENNPGYDEYIINASDIGHNIHSILAYITTKYGNVEELATVQEDLKALFNEVYTINYEEEIEIRYREESGTDKDGKATKELVPYEYKKLIVTLTKKSLETIILDKFKDNVDYLSHYSILVLSSGNMENVFGKSSDLDNSEIVKNPKFENPGIVYDDEKVAKLFDEAEKHIGKKYIFGANGPNNFDCSSFVCWSFSKSNFKNMPRTTAYQIFTNYCTKIDKSQAKAGDLIFFGGTYNSHSPISHVGIYAGNGIMLHAGNPIQYTSIETSYWQSKFYCFGRIK